MHLAAMQHGHFELESGLHAPMWMDLETLFLEPRRMESLAAELATRMSPHNPQVICGPLVEGAFVGLSVARQLDLRFAYTERSAPYVYKLPRVLREHVAGRRVAIINDVISAGSAVRGAADSLDAAGAHIVAIGALLVLGDWTRRFAAEKKIAVEALSESAYEMWKPADCPLCARGMALERSAAVSPAVVERPRSATE
ncbi:MAG TPA: orotate phosphoribosyltransferase [Thermoanaerobaculia bacterium]